MPKSNSNPSELSSKPSKLYPDFPLFAHATKRWAKKIRGKMHYFGPWDDPDGALKKYQAQKDALHSGRKLREVTEGLTVKNLCNAFLNHKKSRLDVGELSPRTWKGCERTAKMLVTQFGKGRLVADLGQDDFAALRKAMSKTWGVVRIRNVVQQVRSIFKYGYESELLTAPMRFGPGFSAPSQKAIRLDRAAKGPRMFEAPEIRALVNGTTVPGKNGPKLVRAGVAVRAMILLGVNCGFGNADCGTLPRSALDLEGGWVNYHRPKTGITRRCPLWPETVAALNDALAERPEPKNPEDAGLVFLTVRGVSWHKAEREDSTISKEMRKLVKALGLTGNKNFYALRHTFETMGGEAKDQVAVDHVMGHARDDMASVYRERISDERLKAVSDFVRNWLFGEERSTSVFPNHT